MLLFNAYRPTAKPADQPQSGTAPEAASAPKVALQGFRPAAAAPAPRIPTEEVAQDDLPSFLKDETPITAPPTHHPYGFQKKKR